VPLRCPHDVGEQNGKAPAQQRSTHEERPLRKQARKAGRQHDDCYDCYRQGPVIDEQMN
jgi:hypothetical protein